MNRLLFAAATGLSTLALVVSGCGGSSEPSPSESSTTSGPASATSPSASADAVVPDPCTLFSDDEIASLTGLPVTQKDTDGAQPTEPVRWCQWQLDGGQLLLTLQQSTPDEFTTAGGVEGAVPVTDVGEAAYSYSGHLYVLNGADQIDVYLRGAGTDEQNIEESKKVALAVIPKLA